MSTLPPQVSIVVPVYNELPNLGSLLQRIYQSMHKTDLRYELIFIDDHSTDGSAEYLREATAKAPFPAKVYPKSGKQGKAYSLLEGFAEATGEYIVMIDADLQYPPEAIPAMLTKLQSDCDIVVANRAEQHVSKTRRRLSRTYRNIVGGILGLDADVQSGLKGFKKIVLNRLKLKPSPWGFDYQFLYLAKRLGWKIGSVDISFAERQAGVSQVKVVRNGLELLWGAVILRLRHLLPDILPFLKEYHPSERYGNNFDNKTDFLYMPEIYSIKRHIYPENIAGFIVVAIMAVLGIWGLSDLIRQSVPVTISGLIAAFYLGLFLFKLFVVRLSLNQPGLDYSKEEIASLKDAELPQFSIIVPLYQEAEVIPQIIKGMSALDYPKDKIDLIITLEEYDHETIDAIAAANPPAWIKTLILPDVKPKTKPKALNVAFPHLKGEFMVIYDAEIIPDPDQLKKAILAFRDHPDVACLQVQLDHYNAYENWVTKLFNAEFSFYYDLFLPGLQKLGIPLPLSGHSSLYRTEAIRQMGAWDPYNVTEDCMLGMQLYRSGYKTEILQARSLEESTNSASTWVGQRTRWIKGFIQTTLVLMRNPLRFKRELGSWWRFFGFLLVVPGSVFVNILNLFYWVLLIAWIATKNHLIQAFFPGAILYVSVFSFIAGNFLFTYLNLIGSFRRQRYDIVKYSLLSPAYWLMLAYATVKASIEIFTKPHHWSKTKHGTHLTTATPGTTKDVPATVS
jgi:cellulose synthase/poly-beta-1,6-N-acetylglucosamine synthase-like glycosyltransferase